MLEHAAQILRCLKRASTRSCCTDTSEFGVSIVLNHFPPELAQLSALEALTLAPSSVTGGTLPAEWSRLSSLKVLSVGRPAAGTLPGEWGNLTQLETLEVTSGGYVTGESELLQRGHSKLCVCECVGGWVGGLGGEAAGW